MLVDQPHSADKWYEFALFSLKYHMQAKAEQYLDKVIALKGMSQEMHLMLASIMLQRQNWQQTKLHLDAVLDKDWLNIHANLLFGFFYKLTGWDEMARKHFAIARVKRLRDLQLLPPKSSIPKNFRTESIDFKVEIIDYAKLKTHDEQLAPKESDLLFFELIEFLISRQIYGTAKTALHYIQDKNSTRYLMTNAKICINHEEYQEATESLDRLLETNPQDQKAWILRGHAFFLLKNLFDSEESYISALRIKTQGKPALSDPVLEMRLGIIYALRRSWKDAKTVFLKVCKDRMQTTAWIYLGLSFIRLNELAQAEDAISQANILDNTNPMSWALSCMLCLKYGKQRLQQARFCMQQSISHGIKDGLILEEVGDLFEEQGLYHDAIQAYKICHTVDPTNGSVMQKLGGIYCNEGNAHQDTDAAIECYKVAIELVKGDSNKDSLAHTLQQLLNDVNRNFEFTPYVKYLRDGGQHNADEQFEE